MPTEHTKRVFEAVRELSERLHPDEDLELEDVRADLEAAGFDTVRMRERLHTAVKELAQTQRKAGKIPPNYLKQAIEATAAPDKLPSDPKAAIEKMKGWVASFQKPMPVVGDLQIARAYRKSGPLSEADRKRLDKLERSLKERAEQLHGRES